MLRTAAIGRFGSRKNNMTDEACWIAGQAAEHIARVTKGNDAEALGLAKRVAEKIIEIINRDIIAGTLGRDPYGPPNGDHVA